MLGNVVKSVPKRENHFHRPIVTAKPEMFSNIYPSVLSSTRYVLDSFNTRHQSLLFPSFYYISAANMLAPWFPVHHFCTTFWRFCFVLTFLFLPCTKHILYIIACKGGFLTTECLESLNLKTFVVSKHWQWQT